jgi:flagellar basal body P-ring formation protein FlgA
MSAARQILRCVCALASATIALSTSGRAADLASAAMTTADAASLAVPLTREKILASLARELTSHFNLEGDLQLELLRPWNSPTQLATTWELSVFDFPSVASSSMLVRCRVIADGAAISEATLLVRANLWRDIWVARLPLTAGGIFDPAQLETRRVDLLRERDALPAAVGDRSYIFTRGVSAGRLLTWHDIARRPLVRKGDFVEVSAGEGGLVVTLKAQAMESGSRGDTVTIRNPESRKDFSAIVIDENHVQVRF